MAISIADCGICRALPGRVAVDSSHPLPQEVARLSVVLEVEDPDVHRYESNVSWLLRCPDCSTLYYKNHHVDEGERFMDPTCDDTVLRRYDLVTAIEYLSGLAGLEPGVTPQPLGRLKLAFLEGRSALTPSLPKQAELMASARRELEALLPRRVELARTMEEALSRATLDPQVQLYAVETLLYHFASRQDWDSLRRVLFEHPDSTVRLLSASQALSIGTRDQSPIDSWHTPRCALRYFATEVARKDRLDELIEVLWDVARNGQGTVPEYHAGFGESSYYRRPIRYVALYGLVVATSHGGDLRSKMPDLVGLIGADTSTTAGACWVLQRVAERNIGLRQGLLRLLEAVDLTSSADERIRKLVALCGGATGKGGRRARAPRKTSPRKGRRRPRRG